jgi:hypothetical protein
MFWAKRTSSHRRLVAASMLTALAMAVTACGGSEEPGQASESPNASPPSASPTEAPTSASPSPTAESPTAALSEEPGGSEESPTASPTSQPSTTVEATEEPPVQPPPPGSGPREMLLGHQQVPGLNEQHGWRLVSTDHGERGGPIWACQVTDFTSIGATDVWVRRFVGQPGGRRSAQARSAVISFVDAISARRAYAVLRAWHDRCEEQLRGEYQRVSVDAAPTAVEVDGPGEAEWRMAIYGPAEGEREAGYFDATGYVREGTRISLTTMVNVGQDYNYPRGEEPIVGAVRNSAVKLRG